MKVFGLIVVSLRIAKLRIAFVYESTRLSAMYWGTWIKFCKNTLIFFKVLRKRKNKFCKKQCLMRWVMASGYSAS